MFNSLVGQILVKVEQIGDTKLIFTTMSGNTYEMYHNQD